ncbi:MAG TPA: ATP-binding protein [Fibrobacteria bacterium]|nr:ATP-binding protein [Fibrobacteria bacterium]HOX52493.1 ATP-binding protein [Fibrobacteria bacterium]
MQREDGVWFEVSDNGVGFDGAFASNLFQPFHRLHGESFEGVGIGLATVSSILQRLGGAIEVDAAEGRGATFRFRLGPPEPAETVRA